MTHFGKKSFIWLVAGSLVASGGAVAWRVSAVGAQRAQDALLQVQKSEADLASLKTRLMQWENAHPQGITEGQTGILHIEPVALNIDFSPGEFTGIGQVLAGMYTEHGSLNLKSLNMEFGTGGTAHVTVVGDKVFVQ